MANPVEPAEKAALERQQLELGVERLKLENQKLVKDNQPDSRWSRLVKDFISLGGILTIAGTAYGLYDSYKKTITERTNSRITEQRVQFEDAVRRLESPGTVSKLVGVSVLNSYLTPENKDFHHQVLFTLASLAATEQDVQVQNALATLISAVPADRISPENWRYFQETLAAQSRALVIKGDLYTKRQFGLTDVSPSPEERSARFVAKLIATNVTRGVVPAYTDYNRIYCVACGFPQAVFPKATNFTASILDTANFAHATLEGASFDNADVAGASFVEADLSGAQFRTLTEAAVNGQPTTEEASRRAITPLLQHLGALLDTRARITVAMPDFSCANLTGSTFEHFALLPVPPIAERKYAKGDDQKPGWYKTVPQYIKDDAASRHAPQSFGIAVIRPPKLAKANLDQAKLEKSRFFTFYYADNTPDSMGSGFGTNFGEFSVALSGGLVDKVLGGSSDQPDGLTDAQRSAFQRSLRTVFYQARNLERASLPDGIADFLKKSSEQTPSPADCQPR